MLDVLYDLNGTDINELRNRLHYIAQHAAGEGLMTGESEAEVDTWGSHVIEWPAEHEPAPGLLAAASDMYEALEMIHEAFIKGEIRFTKQRWSDLDPYHPANTKMSVALAKARGEPQ